MLYKNEEQPEEDPYADPFDQLDQEPDPMDYDEDGNIERRGISVSEHLGKHIILIADYINKQ